MNQIRNFCIIAHIDHGKSTLADRLLELTGTVEARRMQAQYLDQMELERERGITVKMAPVQMQYTSVAGETYALHLIDTPGHSDFSYEVSRALAAVEGAILLVDGVQGVQAQTLANLRTAREAGLTIIPAVNKVDLFYGHGGTKYGAEKLEETLYEVAELLEVATEDIFCVSAKTGEGIQELLEAVVRQVPAPTPGGETLRALVFDSFYDNHKGIVASIRLFGGVLRDNESAYFHAADKSFRVKELGHFSPQMKPGQALSDGEIGYIATGLKDPSYARIGDTVLDAHNTGTPLQGYREPQPVVFVSLYPEDGDDYESLGQSLQKLKLNDASLVIEYDQNEILGRGFKVGFLGKLHYEITAERLRQEFDVETVHTFPSVRYRIKTPSGWEEITRPEHLPEQVLEIQEPVAEVALLLPVPYLNNFLAIQHQFRIHDLYTETVGGHVSLTARIPLAELMTDFDDTLKSITEGYGSFSYELSGYETADVVKVDILVSGEEVPGMSRFFPRDSYEREGRQIVERLKDLLPRQQYAQPVQAAAGGRIIARETVPALRKDVTGHLYGGDRTRKMKLWKKQQRGKKKLKELSQARIDPDMFKELLKK